MNRLARSLLPAFLAWVLALPAVAAADTAAGRQWLETDGSRLELLISDQFNPAMREDLRQWVAFIAHALRQVYGRWPRRHWQISVEPIGASGSDPIPWAQVRRGEIDRVEFFASVFASAQELREAWTSYHELAHLLIPYRGWGDAWFSEGLASYYQNIIQARAGLISEQAMWQNLYDGFQRGLADRRYRDRSLRSVSDDLRENGAFMRVYWSGAWYFLAADARLRLQSAGRLTLDTALEKLNRCCAEQRLSVVEIVDSLDTLNRVVLFSSLYEQVGDSTAVPPFQEIFASLGIDVIDGRVRLQDQGPGASLRREISSSRADVLNRQPR